MRDKLDGKKCFKHTGIKRPAKVLARSPRNSKDEAAVGEAANTDTELPACSGLCFLLKHLTPSKITARNAPEMYQEGKGECG